MRSTAMTLALVTAMGNAQGGRAGAGTERRYLLEQVGDIAIVQLYADGFDQLTRDEKLLCYWLAQAAIAGRDVYIDQKFAHSLAIRDLLEELWLHRAEFADAVRAEVERYCKRFWVNNGIHHAVSTHKELLHLDRAQFEEACARAERAGAALPAAAERQRLFSVLTDPATFASCTNKSPGDGKDPLLESCNNLYVGVSSKDLDGFAEQHALNSRLVKGRDGQLVEEVYRCGGPTQPAGRYAKELTRVVAALHRALPHAPPPTRAALEHLIRYYQTGANEDWRKFNVAWVADKDSTVDFVNGFVEVYLDARGQKGAFEGIVSFRDPVKTRAIATLAEAAPWFEARMPWADEWKKKDVKGISARAITVVIETGDSGPVTPVGINLPNENDIRRDHGSKSVNLGNVVDAYERSKTKGATEEFSWSADEAARAERFAATSGDIHTNLHEVIGHASGQSRPEVVDPMQRLGQYASTLEEARADLVGLYWIPDPKLKELGIVTHDEMPLAEYEAYARNALLQLRRVPKGGKLEEDHMRNRQLIVHWLLANDGGVQAATRDGKTYYRVTSVEAFRNGCGRLLAEVMRIKGTGDFKAGKELVDRYGTRVEPKLHEEVLARVAKLNLPSVTGFVQPELRAVTDEKGAIVDVVVEHPCDLAAQMLRWSGKAM
jgi:dipeptidyl-peptidase-3